MKESPLCLLLIAVVATISSFPAYASEERAMAFSSFTFQANDSDIGAVTVTGTQGSTGITALTIRAFQREFKLSAEQLQALKGMIVNGVQLSAEGGYPQLGGKTVYVQLSVGFTSGTAARRLVVITERGDLSIRSS